MCKKIKNKVPECPQPKATDGDGVQIYKILSLFVGIPTILLLTAVTFGDREEEERPPFIKYEYLRRRTKRFPWGDGQKSLFHNPKTNALPDGYEN